MELLSTNNCVQERVHLPKIIIKKLTFKDTREQEMKDEIERAAKEAEATKIN